MFKSPLLVKNVKESKRVECVELSGGSVNVFSGIAKLEI